MNKVNKKLILVMAILALFLGAFSAEATTKTVKKPAVKVAQCLPDPVMVKQVADLTAENTSLKSKNVDLQTQVDLLKKYNASFAIQNVPVGEKAGCSDAKADVVKYNQQLLDNQTKYDQSVSKMNANSGGMTRDGQNSSLQYLSNEKLSNDNTIYAKLNLAQSQVQQYCN